MHGSQEEPKWCNGNVSKQQIAVVVVIILKYRPNKQVEGSLKDWDRPIFKANFSLADH